MSSQYLLAALLFSNLALTTPLSKRDFPPSVESLGPLQVLHYNSLGPQNNGTSAVISYDRSSYSDAAAKCVTIGEKLQPWSSHTTLNQTELEYEIDYLIFAKELPENESLWVSTGSSDGNTCYAFSPSKKTLIKMSCNSLLPALCTSSPPPTTDLDGIVRSETQLKIISNGYTLTGYRDARSFRFLGIPFANPPLNDLRLAPPEPYTGPKTLDATNMADSCIQPLHPFGLFENRPISEDCLYLNVYTPFLPSKASERTTLRPVAVYLYGGSFRVGSSAMIDYDGGNFASRNDVVIVVPNYRLGALGFLSTGNLTTGNYGIYDQIMALEWVQKNIAAFGGDPSRVTVFGQSAGGQSVIALLSSSAAKGLFSGALVQSAPVDFPWFSREVYSKYIAPQTAQAVGCYDASTEEIMLKCLRSVDSLNYLENSTAFQAAYGAIDSNIANLYFHTTTIIVSDEPFMPMVDDTGSGVVEGQFYKLLQNKTLPIRVPTMFTTVRDEDSLFIGQATPNLGSSQARLDDLLYELYGPALATDMISSGAFKVNHSDPDGVRNGANAALTESEWTCPQGYLLNHAGNLFPSLYEVVIADGHEEFEISVPAICFPNNDYNASCHASDVLLAWGNLNSKTKNVLPYYSDQDIRHSQVLNDIFGAYFRTHNPNPNLEFLKVRGPAYATTYNIFAGDYSIKQYHPSDRSLSLLGMPPSSISNFANSAQCAVIRDYGFIFQRADLVG